MSKRKILSILISAFVIVFITNHSLLSNSNAGPFGNTGSPGDNGATCSKPACHSNIINSGTGTISLDLSDIPVEGFAAGETYDIKVNLSENGRATYGFQVTAEDNSGGKVGSYTGNTTTLVTFSNWVTHKKTSATGSWMFQWKAPQNSPSQVTFYAIGNAANGNGSTSGDHLYTTSKAVQLNPLASINELGTSENIQIFYDPMSLGLRITSDFPFLANLFNMEGKHLMAFQVKSGTSFYDLSSIEKGMYALVDGEGTFSKKVIIY